MLPAFANALVLTGPTGSGKTPLGIETALRLGAEIVSMDSMALYRGMDIGTAKPAAAERRAVPHHLIDVLDPWESASVAWWLLEATRITADIEARGKRVLFVGGTPLYLKALIFGLFKGPQADEAVRRRLADEAEASGVAVLHGRLRMLDPRAAERIHANDLRRIIRALEVFELTGRPLSELQTQWRQGAGDRGHGPGVEGCESGVTHCATPAAILWLDLPRAELYERINRRVDAMFAAGLVEEVRTLRSSSRALGREATQALGYKEVLAHLDGERELAETVALVKTRSRNFAKRQITWFRRLPGCRPATSQLTQALWQPTMK